MSLTDLLRNVLLLLLLGSSGGKPRCNYREIIGSYSEIIFVELQNLDLTGPFPTSKERDPCPSQKAHRILVSIYGMLQQRRCHSTGKRQLDLEKPLQSMEQLIINNCRPDYQDGRASCSAGQKIRGKKRKRIRTIRVIKALITCWQKLQSAYLF